MFMIINVSNKKVAGGMLKARHKVGATDAQMHGWGTDASQRPWLLCGKSRVARPVPIGASDLIQHMDDGEVYRAALMPPSRQGDCNNLRKGLQPRYLPRRGNVRLGHEVM